MPKVRSWSPRLMGPPESPWLSRELSGQPQQEPRSKGLWWKGSWQQIGPWQQLGRGSSWGRGSRSGSWRAEGVVGQPGEARVEPTLAAAAEVTMPAIDRHLLPRRPDRPATDGSHRRRLRTVSRSNRPRSDGPARPNRARSSGCASSGRSDRAGPRRSWDSPTRTGSRRSVWLNQVTAAVQATRHSVDTTRDCVRATPQRVLTTR